MNQGCGQSPIDFSEQGYGSCHIGLESKAL